MVFFEQVIPGRPPWRFCENNDGELFSRTAAVSDRAINEHVTGERRAQTWTKYGSEPGRRQLRAYTARVVNGDGLPLSDIFNVPNLPAL